jgi:hypothetical protein
MALSGFVVYEAVDVQYELILCGFHGWWMVIKTAPAN